MPSAPTDPTTINNEKQLVRELAQLSSDDGITLNDRGWDSRVYSFDNGCYFFKFPRSKQVQDLYKYEIAAIKFVNDIDSDIVAQKILWEHPENAYFGYEGVQGQPLFNIIEKLSTEQKRRIGQTIGHFLKQFSTRQLPGARKMSLKDESKQIQRWYNDSLAFIPKYFNDQEQTKLRTFVYEIWPATLLQLGEDPVLCHCDLHFENILYGDNGDVGIIDFGDVAYCDRSKDLLELANDPVLFDAALKAYGSIDKQLKQKITVRQAMIQIINFGFYASKSDKKSLDETILKIKQNLESV